MNIVLVRIVAVGGDCDANKHDDSTIIIHLEYGIILCE